MGKFFTGAQQGGSRPEGVASVLHRSDSGCLALWVGDVGINAADGEGPGQFPVQDREEDHGETTAAKEGRELDIPAEGGNNKGYRNGGDTDLNSPEAEYRRAIHCDAVDSGPMRAGHPLDRRAGVLAVVGTDGDRPEGSARKGGRSSCRNEKLSRSQRTSRAGPREEEERRSPKERAGPVEEGG